MKPEEVLKQFYRAYWDWLQAGAPEGDAYMFKRYYGLCLNLNVWLFDYTCEYDNKYAVINSMSDQFIAAGLSNVYPFDTDPVIYKADQANNRLHLNPRRIAWVKEHMQ